MDDKPTEITIEDIDNVLKKIENGDFDIKKTDCLCCGKSHLPNYGWQILQCDECFFSRYTKEQKEEFFRRILEDL